MWNMVVAAAVEPKTTRTAAPKMTRMYLSTSVDKKNNDQKIRLRDGDQGQGRQDRAMSYL